MSKHPECDAAVRLMCHVAGVDPAFTAKMEEQRDEARRELAETNKRLLDCAAALGKERSDSDRLAGLLYRAECWLPKEQVSLLENIKAALAKRKGLIITNPSRMSAAALESRAVGEVKGASNG